MYFCMAAVHLPHSPPNEFFGEKVAGTQPNAHMDMLWEVDLQVVSSFMCRYMLSASPTGVLCCVVLCCVVL